MWSYSVTTKRAFFRPLDKSAAMSIRKLMVSCAIMLAITVLPAPSQLNAMPYDGGTCPEDLDGCGTVDFHDLAILLGDWGDCRGCVADINGDGDVDAADLSLLLGAWGVCD